MTEKAVEMSNDIEEMQIEVRTAICQLSEASLREVYEGLQIEVKEMDKGRLALIHFLTKYLHAEESGTEALKNLREATKEKEDKKLVVAKTEEESDVKLKQEEKKSAVEQYRADWRFASKISPEFHQPGPPNWRRFKAGL